MTGTDVAEGAIVATVSIRDVRKRFSATDVLHGARIAIDPASAHLFGADNHQRMEGG